ncbi:MAG TPA: N-acetylmuramic acid 6-phosphate etherase [Chthoniobacteraceae bacterium]|nr:N-acetylmuramic acid 6-phosphate etherase [Chthoniobacteraceae bacterium]
MKTILGIEGGGTKTEWIAYSIAEPGERAAPVAPRSGILPPSNLRLISDESLERLLRVLPPEATDVGVFLAGCVTEGDHERLRALVRGVWPDAAILVGSDRESGFAAAFHGADGVAVIAGTGSAITGKCGDLTDNAGGWGHLLGSAGSGYRLAMQALRQVLWSYDLTRRVTSPGEAILARLGLNRLEDLIAWAADAEKMAIARLAPVVFEAAKEGDRAMAAILDEGAATLAEGAAAVARRLALPQADIRLQGGLFVHYPEYVGRFEERLAAFLPKANVAVCTVSGAEGAAWLASRRNPPTAPLARPFARYAPPIAPALEVDTEELANAATEQVNPRSARLDELSNLELVDLFIAEEAHVAEALKAARDTLAEAIELVAGALRRGGRLFYVGAGTSGRLGTLDASEIPPTFGVDPRIVQAIMAGGATALYRSVEGAEDHPEAGGLAILDHRVQAGDVVCGITASGRTPFVLGALHEARAALAHTVLLTCNPARKRHAPAWDIEIDLPTGPELLTGSTRLKAGSATKLALNLLSTGAMIRLGKVRGNLMSGVRVSNVKLRERAIRTVARTLRVTPAEAEALLAGNDWQLDGVLRSR